MCPFKKTIILLAVLALFSIHFPQISLAVQNSFTRTAKAKSITEHSPRYQKTPEEEIPVETVQRRKSNKWLWVGLGVLAAGVLAGAGGGGGGGNNEPSPASKTDIEVQWE